MSIVLLVTTVGDSLLGLMNRVNSVPQPQPCETLARPMCMLPSLFLKYYGVQGNSFESYLNELD